MLIDGKPFFEIPVKNKEELYEAIIEMSKNNDYTRGNLLDYELDYDYDSKQQINFIGRLEENNAIIFFIIEKKGETFFIFHKVL